MMAPLELIEPLFRCPVLRRPIVRKEQVYQTEKSNLTYATILGKPVLIDFSQSIISESELFSNKGASAVQRHDCAFKSLIRSSCFQPGAVGLARQNARSFLNSIMSETEQKRILVVGGGTVGIGSAEIVNNPETEVLSFDVYNSPNVQFLADAHQIPLADSSIDGVWIQYVLEHVLDPWRVVAEICRVLKPEGIVYAETPFLQQVHEGAYDFTRFTQSGHRWLFRNFREIDSGMAMGQGIQLLWTLEHLVRGVTHSKLMGKAAKFGFFWIQAIDKLIPVRFGMNSASSFYFLGKKSSKTLQASEMRRYYAGSDSTP